MFMLVSGMFTAFLVCLSDTARDGPTPAGMAGLRHKQRHRPGLALTAVAHCRTHSPLTASRHTALAPA